ncbi:MAG: class I SAM-dependent methyltransferase [Christensenellales bacterium]|jgi:SAM-dependent methyltransferase
MMFLWNPDMIRFMRDASEHTGYHRALASRIHSYLGPKPEIVDAGCGLGYLSLALSQKAGMVVAVDKNHAPLEVLKENIKKRGVTNVLPVCADLEELELPGARSAVVFCFCGDGKLVVNTAKRLKARKAFSIGSMRGKRDEDKESVPDLLQRHGLPHQEEFFTLSLDQPFRTEEDALLFFETYREKEPYSLMSKEDFLARLQRGREGEFPLLLPIVKQLRMTVFDPADVPDWVE